MATPAQSTHHLRSARPYGSSRAASIMSLLSSPLPSFLSCALRCLRCELSGRLFLATHVRLNRHRLLSASTEQKVQETHQMGDGRRLTCTCTVVGLRVGGYPCDPSCAVPISMQVSVQPYGSAQQHPAISIIWRRLVSNRPLTHRSPPG